MTALSPLDAFKAILSGTARALARDSEAEVGFTADAPHLVGKAIKVPAPGRTLPRALFLTLGKLPEAMGVVQFWLNRLLRRRAALIEYK